MNTINAEEEEREAGSSGGVGGGAGAETRARRALNVFIANNKRRRLSQLLLLSSSAAAPVSSSGEDDEDIQCLDHIRAAARHHGTALPCRSCLPRDIRRAASGVMQAYLAAWRSASSSNDRFLCAADLPTDDISTEDVVSATEDDEDEDDGHC